MGQLIQLELVLRASGATLLPQYSYRVLEYVRHRRLLDVSLLRAQVPRQRSRQREAQEGFQRLCSIDAFLSDVLVSLVEWSM